MQVNSLVSNQLTDWYDTCMYICDDGCQTATDNIIRRDMF